MTTTSFLVTQWNWDPILLTIGLAMLAACRPCWTPRHVLFLGVGFSVFLLGWISPLHRLSDGFLFSAHMLEHLLTVLIAPPLILLGRSSSPVQPQHRFGRWFSWLRFPFWGWALGVGAMWIWHLPFLCGLAARDPMVHRFQYLSFFLMGLAFWRPILGARPEQRLSPLAGIVYLFTACMACTILGIILTFAPLGVCPSFLSPAGDPAILSMIRTQWRLTPATDQQLGGLMMWVPACLVYLTGILALLFRWMNPAKASWTAPARPSLSD